MKKIAIFASGGGSNALKIIQYFESNHDVEVSIVMSNRVNAKVLDKAKTHNINTLVFSREMFYNSEDIKDKLNSVSIDLIVLAGFLWLIPEYLIEAFPNKIINIHPALLPKYGGKGMYGHHVHEAVKAAKEKESGITIHYVNNEYDEGAFLFQTACNLEVDDDPIMIAQKVLKLEHQYFSIIIDKVLNGKINV